MSRTPEYGDQEYWDERYSKDKEEKQFEWYLRYVEIANIMNLHMPKDGRILQIGVGTSCIQEDMALDGYQHIHSIDYSPVCIDWLRSVHAKYTALTYEVADCRSMPQFPDASFDSIFDKGTLDAILCSNEAEGSATQLLAECSRLLRVGGCFLVVTYGSPDFRLSYLAQLQYRWNISIYTLKAPEDESLRRDRNSLQIGGPYSVDEMADASLERNAYFMYVCQRCPEPTPENPGSVLFAKTESASMGSSRDTEDVYVEQPCEDELGVAEGQGNDGDERGDG